MLFVTLQRLTVTRSGLLTNIKSFNRLHTTFKLPDKNIALISSRFLTNKYKFSLKPQRNIYTSISGQLYSVKGIQENISALHMKKRPLRKKRNITEDDDSIIPGFWNVKSLATAEEYDLERLMDGLIKQDLYFPERICTSSKYNMDLFQLLHDATLDKNKISLRKSSLKLNPPKNLSANL